MNRILLTASLTLGLVVAPLSAAPALAAPAVKPAAIQLTAMKSVVKPAAITSAVTVDNAAATATVVTKQGISLVHWERTLNSTTRGTWQVVVVRNRAQVGFTKTMQAAGVQAVIRTLQQKGKGKTYAYDSRTAVVDAVKAAAKSATV